MLITNVLTGCLRCRFVHLAIKVFTAASYELQDGIGLNLPHPHSEFQNYSNIGNMSTHTEICRFWELKLLENTGVYNPHLEQLTINSLVRAGHE